MKGRIAVWVIVGIVVIAGVIFLVSSGSRRVPGATLTLDKVKSDATAALRQADRLTARIAELEKALGPAGDTAGNVSAARQAIADGRGKLESVLAATELNVAADELKAGKQSLRKARRALQLAGKGRQAPRGF